MDEELLLPHMNEIGQGDGIENQQNASVSDPKNTNANKCPSQAYDEDDDIPDLLESSDDEGVVPTAQARANIPALVDEDDSGDEVASANFGNYRNPVDKFAEEEEDIPGLVESSDEEDVAPNPDANEPNVAVPDDIPPLVDEDDSDVEANVENQNNNQDLRLDEDSEEEAEMPDLLESSDEDDVEPEDFFDEEDFSDYDDEEVVIIDEDADWEEANSRVLFQHWHPDMDNRQIAMPTWKADTQPNLQSSSTTLSELMIGYKLLSHMWASPPMLFKRFHLLQGYMMKHGWIKLHDELTKMKILESNAFESFQYFLTPFGIQLLKAAIDLKCKTVIRCLLSGYYGETYSLPKTFVSDLLAGNILMPMDYPNSRQVSRYQHNECLTPLQYAYMIGHTDMTKLLLDCGADWAARTGRYLEKNPSKPLSLMRNISVLFLAIVNKDLRTMEQLLKLGIRPTECSATRLLRDTFFKVTPSDIPLWAVAMEMADLRPLVSLLSSYVGPEIQSYPMSRQMVCVETDYYTIDSYFMNVNKRNYKVASILFMAGLDGVLAHYYCLKLGFEQLFQAEGMTEAEKEQYDRFVSLIRNPRSLAVISRNAGRDAIHKAGKHVPTAVQSLDLGLPQINLLLCRDLLQYL